MLNRLPPLKSMDRSLESSYGTGPTKYFKFIYYSLLRVNTFVVLRAGANDFQGCQDGSCMTGWDEIDLKKLKQFRSVIDLPREFHIDEQGWATRCFGVWDDELLCHLHWVHTAGDYSRFLTLGEKEAEINFIVTLPSHRSRGLCSAAVRQTLKRLFQEGLERVYSVVHSNNHASLNALGKAGLKPAMLTRALGPFNLKIRPSQAARG